MKRILASALILSSFSLIILVGCDQKTEEKVEVKEKTPIGSSTTTQTTEVKKTGDEKAPEPAKAP